MKIIRFITELLLLIFITFPVFIQAQFASSAFNIESPILFDELRSAKISDPQMTPEIFSKKANVLLNKVGLPFTFIFNDEFCDSISRSTSDVKGNNSSKNLQLRLATVGGEPAQLILPPADFSNNQCSKCALTLPVFEVTDKHFISLLSGVKIKFERPVAFGYNESLLVNDKNYEEIKIKWKLPFNYKPIGVSYDGSILYMELNDPLFKDLAIMIFSEGVYQFTTRKEAEKLVTSQIMKMPQDPSATINKFKINDRSHIVRFNEKCAN